MAPRRSARIKTLEASKPNQARLLPSLVGVEKQQKSTKPKAGMPKTTTTTTTTTTGGKKGKGGGVTKTKKKPTSTTTKSKSKGKKTTTTTTTTTTKKTNPKKTTPRTSASPAKPSPVKDLATTLQSRATDTMANIARKVSSSAEAIVSPTNNNRNNTGSPARKQPGILAKAAEAMSPNRNDRARTPGRAVSSPSPGKRGVGVGAGTVGKGRAKSEGRA